MWLLCEKSLFITIVAWIIMIFRATVTSISSDESPARVRKWESVQQDIGYSSGENSVHEALNSLADNHT